MKYQKTLMALFGGVLMFFGCEQKANNNRSANDTSKSAKVNLDEIFYTTPTINNALPEFEKKVDSCSFFHEDEWRQIEFISKSQKASIDKEIVKIRNIHEHFAHKGEAYTLYKDVAVRDLIRQPLSIIFTRFKSYITDKPIKMYGLGLENNDGQVKNGFFFTVNGINYYGLLENDNVSTLGIYSADSDEDLRNAVGGFKKLLANEGLYLVDWRTMHVFDESNIDSIVE